MNGKPWTKEMDQRLTALWEADRSVNTISSIMTEEFQTRLSRNAIVGRVHRIGLPQRQNPVVRVVQAPPIGIPTAYVRCKWLMGRVDRPEAPVVRRRRGNNQTVTHPPVVDLRDPEPNFTCWAEVPQCENQAHPGHVYCAAHCARAYPNFVPMQQAAE